MTMSDLSRFVAHALRHEPWRYELELDAGGWVAVADLLAAVRKKRRAWSAVSESDLSRMIVQSEKARFELRDGRIRALYGHSTPQRLVHEAACPPDALYHGTAPETAETIRREGLKPMGRQYVHLSTDTATAARVGRRKAAVPLILRVRSADAHAVGIRFYRGHDRVWLADAIPPAFIEDQAPPH